MAYLPRVMDELLSRALGSAGAVLMEGPRGCGKTSTALQACGSAVHLDLDESALDTLALDPRLVLGGDAPQLIDEWQVAGTRVWNSVRAEVDRRGLPGQFILTGSAMPDDDVRRHTGAGRFARLSMRPMTLFESGESTGQMSLSRLLAGERPTSSRSPLEVSDIAALVVRGGWPTNVSRSIEDAASANVNYLRSITEVDLPRVDPARRDPALAERLLRALARNTAMEHKVARLASETHGVEGPIARTTAYDYLTALERLMILELQQPWATHLRSRALLRRAPRTHFTDPSLAAAALGAGPARLLSDPNFLGLLFESLVVRDCRVYAGPLEATVHHYRDSDGLEVDVVVQGRDGRWGAFEVKLGTSQVQPAAERLIDFAAKVDTGKTGEPAVLGVITGTGYGYTRADGVVVIPVGAFGP